MQIIKFATTLCAATAALMPAVAGMRSREHAHATNSLVVHGGAPAMLDSSDSRLFRVVTRDQARVLPGIGQGNPAHRASMGRAKMQEHPARAHFQALKLGATVIGTGNSNAAAQQRVPLADVVTHLAEVVTPEMLIARKAALRIQGQNPPTSDFLRKRVQPQRSAENLPAVKEDYGAVPVVTGGKKWMMRAVRGFHQQGKREKRKVAPAGVAAAAAAAVAVAKIRSGEVTSEMLIAKKAVLRMQGQNEPTSDFLRRRVQPQRSAENLPAVEEDYGAVAVTGEKKWMRLLRRHQGGRKKRNVAPAPQALAAAAAAAVAVADA